MSVFLCGLIWTRHQDPHGGERLDLAWAIQREAVRRGLMVQLGPAIFQDTVFGLLGLQDRFQSPRCLPFHLTGTPLSNTSEEAIWPESPPSSRDSTTRERAVAIADFLSWMLSEGHATQVTVVLAENLNPPSGENRITPAVFTESFLQCVEDPTYVVEARWAITLPGAPNPSEAVDG